MNHYKLNCKTLSHTIRETKIHTIIVKLLHMRIKFKQHGTLKNL